MLTSFQHLQLCDIRCTWGISKSGSVGQTHRLPPRVWIRSIAQAPGISSEVSQLRHSCWPTYHVHLSIHFLDTSSFSASLGFEIIICCYTYIFSRSWIARPTHTHYVQTITKILQLCNAVVLAQIMPSNHRSMKLWWQNNSRFATHVCEEKAVCQPFSVNGQHQLKL